MFIRLATAFLQRQEILNNTVAHWNFKADCGRCERTFNFVFLHLEIYILETIEIAFDQNCSFLSFQDDDDVTDEDEADDASDDVEVDDVSDFNDVEVDDASDVDEAGEHLGKN